MTNLYGITGLKVRLFWTGRTESYSTYLNDFLKEHDGNIIDIKSNIVEDGGMRIMVIYK